MREGIPGRGHNMCSGPEAKRSTVHLRKRKAIIANVQTAKKQGPPAPAGLMGHRDFVCSHNSFGK